ncbi:MAG: hypothetical protein NTW21_04235 [Verrucomicrobia bacterium]|nr:hypothetical protein [Verrucomicrobiota bacterium]
MSNPFFDHPILNSPYESPRRHWELASDGQPTQRLIENRHRAEFITPIPKPKKRKGAAKQGEMVFDGGKGLSTAKQQYDPTSNINQVRGHVDTWRNLPNPAYWQVTSETARLLQHWRHHPFSGVRPFFCQIEAVETAIWLTEVAPLSVAGKRLLEHLASANKDANPELDRLALKLATGTGKTTVMAMLTEGWDANTVTHVLGVRAFGTQLLCEQVIGRALRRQSYALNDDSILELTPELTGPTRTRIEGIIGEGIDINAEHLGDMRPSTRLCHLTQRLLYTKWRDPGEAPKLHLFGQLKRITKQWLDTCLQCKGGTYPAQLMYQEFADMACERITAGITRAFVGERPIKALLDPYNPVGSTNHVRFNTSRTLCWETKSDRSHINWVILDSDREAEFCRVAEAHPKAWAYVKNHNLGLEVPYRYGSEMRRYLPDFIVLADDGHGPDDLLHLVVEIKGYRREDAMEKASTMNTYWVPGVNHLGTHGRWPFAEFCDGWEIEADFEAKIESQFNQMIQQATSAPATP